MSTGNRRFLICMYILAAFLFWTSQYWYMATLPLYVKSRVPQLTMVGTVLAMYGLWQAIIRLPLGIMADWCGRRKPFIIGCFALAGIGAWMMGTANGMYGLIVGRAFTGLAAGGWVLLIVAFSGLFPPKEAVRATALLTLSSSFAKILGTGMTGFLNNWGGYSLAFFMASGTACVAIIVLLPIGDRRRAPQRPTGRKIFTLIVRHDVFVPAILSAGLQYVSWGTTFGFLPIQARLLGASDVMQSIMVTMNVALVTLGNLTTTAIVQKIGSRPLVKVSFLFLFFGSASAALASNLVFIFVAQFFFGLAWGICYPVLMGMSIQHVDEAERATAMGLHQAVYAVGMFAGPWMSGILADSIGIKPMFGVTGVLCLFVGSMSSSWLKSI